MNRAPVRNGRGSCTTGSMTEQRLEDLALIGNCQCSALVDRFGSIVWSCLPRFDSEPVFGRLLDPQGGHFTIAPPGGGRGEQRYLPNTNVVETIFHSDEGSFRVIDFAPRWVKNGRNMRPSWLVRIIDPLSGSPRVGVECQPIDGWAKQALKTSLRGDHLVYEGRDDTLFLTTDVPLSYLDGRPFAVTERRYMIISDGERIDEDLGPLCERLLFDTCSYWERWVKHCNVPAQYQQQVIRSALALKMHVFEDTGAIVAAMTTSLPESPGAGRTWDYRYCWLRDAYYAIDAFRLLGHFEEREHFLEFLLSIAAATKDLDLQPLYRIDGRTDLEEVLLPHWAGYNGEGPVRIGNGAATHLQNDIFGEMVLALSPIFVDDRFHHERTPSTWSLLKRLTNKAIAAAGVPDAGIWEYRTEWVPQSFSTLMCWAAADRAAHLAKRHEPALVPELRGHADRIQKELLDNAWSSKRGALMGTYGGEQLDAAMLQSMVLGLLPADDVRLHQTVDAIMKDLDHDGWLLRYRADDGFGVPQVAFVICFFWLIEALAALGRLDEARAHLDRVVGIMPKLGLIAEDWDPKAGRMWGNFPQAYSHVGLIHAAFASSRPWAECL